jgi:hypothetical protein
MASAQWPGTPRLHGPAIFGLLCELLLLLLLMLLLLVLLLL